MVFKHSLMEIGEEINGLQALSHGDRCGMVLRHRLMEISEDINGPQALSHGDG
jgi:hypothetical protein